MLALLAVLITSRVFEDDIGKPESTYMTIISASILGVSIFVALFWKNILF